MKTGTRKPCEKKKCLVCNSERTTANVKMKVCGEVFEIQSGPLNFTIGKSAVPFEM